MMNRWKESFENRVTTILFIQVIGSALILILLVNMFLNEFSMLQLKMLFWVLALVSSSLAIEDMLRKKQRSVYMLKFSTTIVYLIFPLFLLN